MPINTNSPLMIANVFQQAPTQKDAHHNAKNAFWINFVRSAQMALTTLSMLHVLLTLAPNLMKTLIVLFVIRLENARYVLMVLSCLLKRLVLKTTVHQ